MTFIISPATAGLFFCITLTAIRTSKIGELTFKILMQINYPVQYGEITRDGSFWYSPCRQGKNY
jgi:hypothetical protein